MEWIKLYPEQHHEHWKTSYFVTHVSGDFHPFSQWEWHACKPAHSLFALPTLRRYVGRMPFLAVKDHDAWRFVVAWGDLARIPTHHWDTHAPENRTLPKSND